MAADYNFRQQIGPQTQRMVEYVWGDHVDIAAAIHLCHKHFSKSYDVSITDTVDFRIFITACWATKRGKNS